MLFDIMNLEKAADAYASSIELRKFYDKAFSSLDLAKGWRKAKFMKDEQLDESSKREIEFINHSVMKLATLSNKIGNTIEEKKMKAEQDHNNDNKYWHESHISFDVAQLGEINNKIEELDSLPIIMVELSEEDIEMFKDLNE